MKYMQKITLPIFFFLFLIIEVNASTISNHEMENHILTYINQYRIQQGLPALTQSKIIAEEAKLHSHNMAIHQVPFGHTNFTQRINRLFSLIQSRGGAENVAYAYKNAEEVVKGWIASKHHRANIIGKYNLTGIGIAKDPQGKIYYTEIFINSKA